MNARTSPGSRCWGGGALLLAAALLGPIAKAQVSAPSDVYLGDGTTDAERAAERQLRGVRRSPARTFRLPAPTADEREAEPHEGLPGQMMYRMGFGRDFRALSAPVAGHADLSWLATTDGGQSATLAVGSPGARAVRGQLRFTAIPAGLEVRVYDPAAPATAVLMPLRPDLAEVVARDGSAAVWTPTVDGETLALEFYLPAGVKTAVLRFSVPRLSHLDKRPTSLDDLGDASCTQEDLACRADEVSDTARRAVAKYLFTSSRGTSSGCTGTLLNDLDPNLQTPYFLTADHCIDNDGSAASMELYWFFERSSCGGPAPAEVTRQLGGATRLWWESSSYASGTDAVLLRLNQSPPRGVGMAGWTTEPPVVGERAVAIHHPRLDLKKLAVAEFDGFADWYLDDYGVWWPPEFPVSHMVVHADRPVEGGSSGSGLWTRKDGRDHLVGTLTGIGPVPLCSAREIWYGRFDLMYPHVRQWLGGADHHGEAGSPITRMTLVDAATGAEVADLTVPDATVDLTYAGTTSFNIVAETAGTVPLGGVRLDLSGPQSAANVVAGPPYALYGAGGGSGLVPGDYTVTATPYAPQSQGGGPLAPVTATFAVVGTAKGAPMSVAGLALVHPATGGVLGEIVDDAAIGVELPDGVTLAVRARTAGDAAVGSVALSVSGASSTVVMIGGHAPFTLPVELPAGAYRFTATPYSGPDGGGNAGTAFAAERVTVSYRDPPVTGFTLVDARGGAPDPDIGPVADGAVVDLAALTRAVSLRADVDAGRTDIGSVELVLDGPRTVRRTANAPPYALADARGGNYQPVWLPNGSYTLTAQPFTGPNGTGTPLTPATVAFTVTGGGTPEDGAVTGFARVDPRGVGPNTVVGPLRDGDVVDVSDTGGAINVRAWLAPGRSVGSVRFELAGPLSVTHLENRGPFLLYGAAAHDDYHVGWLPNGDYTLTATAFALEGARGEHLGSTEVSFTVVGFSPSGSRVIGFTLVDARDGPPDPDLGAIADGGTVDVSAAVGRVNIRANLSPDAPAGGSVRLELRGARELTRVQNARHPVYTLFGDQSSGTDYHEGYLPDGAYTLVAIPHNRRDQPLRPRMVRFTVTGNPADSGSVSFTRVDPRDAASDLDVGELADGATVDVSTTDGAFNARAGFGGYAARSVRFELAGPTSISHVDNSAPFSLFGDDAGNYATGWLPDGAYTLSATAHTGADATGGVLRTFAVSFTVTGFDATDSPVASFTLVDARGAPPDPDLAVIADGAVLDPSLAAGAVNVRADVPPDAAGVGSVRFELRGARDVTGVEAAGTPYALFGADADGDYAAGELPDGAYTLVATPYASPRAQGARVRPRGVAFAVASGNGPGANRPAVAGFNLIDARHPTGTDLGAIADGDTVDVSVADGLVDIAVDVSRGDLVGSAVFDLDGPRQRRYWLDRPPFSLFGHPTGGYYRPGWLPNGAYTLTATLHEGRTGSGAAQATGSIGFEVVGAFDAAVAGFVLADARRGTLTDIGSIPEGAVLDLGGIGAHASIRAEIAWDLLPVDAVRFALAGARRLVREDPSGGPWSLFGDAAGEDPGGLLPDGAYSLTAHAVIDGVLQTPTRVRFTVASGTATFSAALSPASVAEGGSADLTVAIANGVTFATDQTITLVASGTASAADYALPATVLLPAGAASVTAVLTTIDDTEAEPVETITVTASLGGAAVAAATLEIAASDQLPEATLSSLALSGIPLAFNSETTSYDVEVAHGVARTTVAATGAGVGATVSIEPPDADAAAPGHQVVLARGANTIRVTVTAEDARPRTYTVTVRRAGRRDFDGLEAAGNIAPRGFWGNGEVLWVTDYLEGKLYAYRQSDGSRLPSRDWTTREWGTHEGAWAPSDLWSDGETMWVADTEYDSHVWAYRLSDGSRLPGQDVPLASDNRQPTGVWGDGETLMVSDGRSAWVYAYRLSDGERREEMEFALPAPAGASELSPWGLWSDGDVYYVVSQHDWVGPGTAYAYRSGGRVPERDIALPSNRRPSGLWSDGRTLWVSDYYIGARLVAYRLPSRSSHAALTLLRLDDAPLAPAFSPSVTAYAASAPLGTARTTLAMHGASGTTIAVAPADADPGSPGHQVDLQVGETALTVVVTAADGTTTRTYTTTVGRAAALPAATIAALAVQVPEGAPAAFRVTLSEAVPAALSVAVAVGQTGEVLAGAPPAQVAVAAGESSAELSVPTGDDSIVEGRGAVAATVVTGAGYRVGSPASATVNVTDNDTATFGLAVSDNEIEEGESSTVTVSVTNGKTFAADQTIALSVSGTALAGDFTLPPSLLLAAGANAATATLAAVDDAEAEGAETVVVSASHQGTPIGSETVTIAASDAVLSDDATLASLSLSDVDIGAFAPGKADYAATVANSVAATTVTASAAHGAASVVIADADGSTDGTTRTVSLAEGANAIRVTVTAEDGAATETYTVVVTREAPADALTASFEDVPEAHDGSSNFTLRLRFSDPVAASYRVLRDEALSAAGGAVRRSRRVDGRSDLWEVHVKPGGDAAVTVALDPTTDDCSVTGAVCTADGRALSNTPSAMVPGPAVKASTNGPLVKLTWATPRDGFGSPSPSDYGVRVSGAPRRVVGAALAGSTAWLALESPVGAEDAVAVAYLGSAMHPLADAAGKTRSGPWSGLAAVNVTGAEIWAPPRPNAERRPADPVASAADGALRLDASRLGLTELTGLSRLTALERLDLSGNAVADLAGLAALVNLRDLDLSSNRVSDLWPLAGLSRLERLSLSNNAVEDVQALAGLANLRVLVLDGNAVGDLWPLAGLAWLENLGLAGNRVGDVSALQDLPRLRRLDLAGNPAADISPLGDVGSLVWLSLPTRGVGVSGDALGRLTRLDWVWFGGAVQVAPDTGAR